MAGRGCVGKHGEVGLDVGEEHEGKGGRRIVEEGMCRARGLWGKGTEKGTVE